jgi:P pilus assembly chaperone PapD
MNHIAPFSPQGIYVYDSSIDTVSAPVAIASTHGVANMGQQMIRVTNEGAATLLIAFHATAANAATDTKALAVLPGTERIFPLPAGTGSIDMVTRGGTTSGSWQVGSGV